MKKNNNWHPATPPFREYKKEVFKNAIKVASFIYQIGEYPALRQPSAMVPIEEITTSLCKEKIRYLKTCLTRYRKLTGKGRGIAGVQVGIPEQIIAVFRPDLQQKIQILINPRIISQSYDLCRYPEMCMSANPIIAEVVRPSWIEFFYYDEEGRQQDWNTKDSTHRDKIYNRVFQHEIDHLLGIVNIDKVQSNELILESDPEFYEHAEFKKVKNNF